MEFATGALGSLLPKLGQLLQDEYNLQKSVRKDVQFLAAELERTCVALRKVGEVPPEQLDELVRNWARDVRELSYDMEDVVDTFLVRVDSPDQPNAEGLKWLLDMMIKIVTDCKIRHQLAKDIKDIKERVKEFAERRDRYNVPSINPAKTEIDPRIKFLYIKAVDLVGIDEPRDQLISWLTMGDDMSKRKQKIVSIFGFGGLGKTTLAKAVYDKLKGKFDCAAFVQVSRNPNIKKVLKDMLHELGENTDKDELRQLIDQLREFLRDKRYLIVVDDIWDIEPWKWIRCALDENNLGSGIITTTRNIDVAEKVGGSYRLKPLTHESSKILFYRRIFGSEDKCPEQFSEVSEKILKKCGGVPLAIITISSLLANKSGYTADDWCELCNLIGSGLGNDPDMNDMRNILLLSYYDLPPHLKTCLLSLSIFPEDYEIRMDRLVWRWIAEDFVQGGKRGDNLFQTGESYFNELVNRSMIQLASQDVEKGISCRVHDMVLDLICSLATEENFVTIADDIEQKACLQNKVRPVRRISLQNTIGEITTSMFQLRYLGLRNTCLAGELPVEIGKLQFLQTLDIGVSATLRVPPASIAHLGRLMCLRVDHLTTLPSGIRKLTSLEELSGVMLLSPDIVKELGGLTKLRVLRIRLPKPSPCLEKALVESLCNLRNIQTLDIFVVKAGSKKLDMVWDSLVPPQRLQEFRAQTEYNCYIPLRLLPAWVDAPTAPHLAVLVVQVMELRQEDVDALGRLPALRVLCLEPYATREMLTVGSGAFPRLTDCKFNYSDIAPVFRQGAMPWLRRLEFCFCVRATIDLGNDRFEFGLENLGCLEEATVSVNCDSAKEAEAEEAKEALRRAEDTHPNRATFDVATVRQSIMRYATLDQMIHVHSVVTTDYDDDV